MNLISKFIKVWDFQMEKKYFSNMFQRRHKMCKIEVLRVGIRNSQQLQQLVYDHLLVKVMRTYKFQTQLSLCPFVTILGLYKVRKPKQLVMVLVRIKLNTEFYSIYNMKITRLKPSHNTFSVCRLASGRICNSPVKTGPQRKIHRRKPRREGRIMQTAVTIKIEKIM